MYRPLSALLHLQSVPFSKRFVPLPKRFVSFSKRFDPSLKRSVSFSKRFRVHYLVNNYTSVNTCAVTCTHFTNASASKIALICILLILISKASYTLQICMAWGNGLISFASLYNSFKSNCSSKVL